MYAPDLADIYYVTYLFVLVGSEESVMSHDDPYLPFLPLNTKYVSMYIYT